VCKLRQNDKLRAQSLILAARDQSGLEAEPAEGDLPEEWAADERSDVHEVHQSDGQVKGVTFAPSTQTTVKITASMRP
jgi:hypothetical protein